jgi:hypothetical protein
MASRYTLVPGSAAFPSANYPGIALVNQRPVLAFDDTTPEACYWTMKVPQGWTGTGTLVVSYTMASATSGTVEFEASVEAVTTGDSLNINTTDSFDAVNSGSGTVPGTAGHPEEIAITLTNADSLEAGDLLRIRLARDADDGTNDTATGDCYVFAVELRDAA